MLCNLHCILSQSIWASYLNPRRFHSEVNYMIMIFLWWLSLHVPYWSHILNLFPRSLPSLSSSPHLFAAAPGQPSRAAIPVVPSTAAPSARASTTTTWCVSPATKATLWKDHPRPSARPTASGASSHPHAEVWKLCTCLDCMCGQVKPTDIWVTGFWVCVPPSAPSHKATTVSV